MEEWTGALESRVERRVEWSEVKWSEVEGRVKHGWRLKCVKKVEGGGGVESGKWTVEWREGWQERFQSSLGSNAMLHFPLYSSL